MKVKKSNKNSSSFHFHSPTSSLSSNNKNLEIDVSSLPEQQKKRCLQLLAQSNVNFCQKENKFMAQIKINGSFDIGSGRVLNNSNSNINNSQPQEAISNQINSNRKQSERNTNKSVNKDQNKNKNKDKSCGKKNQGGFHKKERKVSETFSASSAKKSQKMIKTATPSSKNIKIEEQPLNNLQKSISPEKQKQSSSQKQKKPTQNINNIVTINIHQQYNTNRQQIIPIPKGKKPITRVIKANKFNQIQKMYPFVQLYIYPKRMTIQTVGQIIEYIYQDFWKFSKSKSQNTQSKNINNSLSIPSFSIWFMNYWQQKFKQKIKYQQNLINFLDSLISYNIKNTGVKIFLKFICQQYSKDSLSYFLVIRQLLKQILNEQNIKQIIIKLKQNKYQKQIQQQYVKQLLKICCCNQQNSQSTYEEQFINITKIMYYNQDKRKNYINMYQMIQYLIQSFNKLHTFQNLNFNFNTNANTNTNTNMNLNLQLSYSQNDSTLNQLLFNSQGNPIQHIRFNKKQYQQINQQNNFIINLIPKQQDQILKQQYNKQKNFKSAVQKCIIQKLHILCQQTQSSFEQNLKIINCLFQSIVLKDKMIWFNFMKVQSPKQSDLLYIQMLQSKYCCYSNQQLFVSQFVCKFYMMPGIRQYFAKKFIF